MSPVIRIDDDVRNELVKRAIELNMVFSTPNEVLKVILDLTKTVPQATSSEFPQSADPRVQELLDGMRDVIYTLSPGGLIFHGKSGKWVASPNNFVAIKVQDKRKRNLVITVYGNPGKFNEICHNLIIKPDRSSYSCFSVDRYDQLPPAMQVIKHAYRLSTKKER
jgi:hypothetical protein